MKISGILPLNRNNSAMMAEPREVIRNRLFRHKLSGAKKLAAIFGPLVKQMFSLAP
jgi:hypothetical protein